MTETLGFKVRLDLDSGYAAFQHTDLGPFISFYAQSSDVGEKGETRHMKLPIIDFLKTKLE